MGWGLNMQTWSFHSGEISPIGMTRWTVSVMHAPVQTDCLRAPSLSLCNTECSSVSQQSYSGNFQLQK